VLASHVLLVTVYEQLGDSEKATRTAWQSASSIRGKTPLRLRCCIKPTPSIRPKPGCEGFASIEFTIDASGFVRDAKLIETQGSDAFGEPGLAAVSWRYAPRFADEAPVDTAARGRKWTSN
jgi:outer membrane biosynthesis protein TonB